MIDRYTPPEMGHIWSLENKYAIWQEIEVLACEAQAELGRSAYQDEEAPWIRAMPTFTEGQGRRDRGGHQPRRHRLPDQHGEVHRRRRSRGRPQAQSLGSLWHDQLRPGRHRSVLPAHAGPRHHHRRRQAPRRDLQASCLRVRGRLCVGRTHGIHAEPMTFGMKFGSWAWALKRAGLAWSRPARLLPPVPSAALSAPTPPSIRSSSSIVCEKLGLVHDPLSTQVISRDHHAYLAGVLATTAATCERIATEVRNLQKTDTLEAEEPFRKGQGATPPCRTSATRSPWRRSAVCRAS